MNAQFASADLWHPVLHTCNCTQLIYGVVLRFLKVSARNLQHETCKFISDSRQSGGTEQS